MVRSERRRRSLWQFGMSSLLGMTFIAALIAPSTIDYLRYYLRDTSRVVPTSWDLTSGKNVLWRVPLGSVVYRSPVIDSQHLYIGTNNCGGFLPRFPATVDLGVLLCIRRSDGQLLWQHSNAKLPTGRVHDWPLQGITSRPCVEGDRLWYLNNRCEVICLDTQGFLDRENDGPFRDEAVVDHMEADVCWQLDLIGKLGVQPHNVSTSTPALWKDRIFLVTGHGVDESHASAPKSSAPSFIALDKQNGRVLWQDDSPGPNILHGQWGSPVVARLGGVTQVLFPGGDGWLYSFDPLGAPGGKGRLLWKFDCNPKDSRWMLGGQSDRNNLLMQPTVDRGLVYIATGRDPEHGEGKGRVWCIDPTGRGDISAELVFNNRDPETPIPHRRVQACIADEGDFTRPNPNSGVVWEFSWDDANKDGYRDLVEQMGRSISSVEIDRDLVFIADTTGILHCLDRRTGRQHWGYDMLAACYSSPLIAGDYVYMGDEDGDISVFRLSSDPQIAMPGGAPVAETNCGGTIYGTMNVRDNVMYIVTQQELIAVGDPAQKW